LKTDFLVIGSGIAGLNFALKTAQYGKVTIVTKKKMMESNTNLAQGGIAAVTRKDDTFESHIEDTLKVGCGLSNRRIVEILVKNGPKEIQSLISFGVKFDKEGNKPDLTREAGHSKDRILHSGDTTGREVEQALAKRVRENKDIEVLENSFAVDLIVEDAKCYGANVFDIKSKEIVNIFSRGTVLATGGAGHVYQNTSNPEIATGDGIAMAFRSGARVEDMEFVQFHPTTLNILGAQHFLISETFRGEGAVLVNEKGERFMKKYDASGELAPRDIVSRAIFNELKEGQVYLDMRHKDKGFILSRFPMIHQECLKYGIDITKDLISVSPAAHYICGGIKTNEYGETNIRNLLAFGECSCTEVHGANRLASNSLLDSGVFSSLGAIKAKRLLKNESKPPKLLEEEFHEVNRQGLGPIETELRKAMWDYVGIVRNEENLNLMLGKLRQMETKMNDSNSAGLNVQFLELKNMIAVSKLITESALMRKESRGTHYREDYPLTDDKNWLKHICLERKGKNVAVSFA
jgi:L-aspartate oxidase